MTPQQKYQNYLISKFMGYPDPTVGSKWDYDRSLDESRHTNGLIVRMVSELGVGFEQKLAYPSYSLYYFQDGKTFLPTGIIGNDHTPAKPYHSSFDWTMKVCLKWDTIYEGKTLKLPIPKWYREYEDLCDLLDAEASRYEITPLYEQLVENIVWYNKRNKITETYIRI